MPAVRQGDEYYITSTAEISAMNQLLARARGVTNDPHILSVVQDVQRYVDQCAARPFNAGRFFTDGLFWVGAVFALITLCFFASVPVGGLFTALISAALIGAAVMRAPAAGVEGEPRQPPGHRPAADATVPEVTRLGLRCVRPGVAARPRPLAGRTKGHPGEATDRPVAAS
jgi:hypothetical protein